MRNRFDVESTSLDAPEDIDLSELEPGELLEELDEAPGDAERTMEDFAPMSEEEADLALTPGLRDVGLVDDASNEAWLAQMSKGGYRSMDRVLDDKIYGDKAMNEEKLERMGLDADESGDDVLGAWWNPVSLAKRAITAPLSAARAVARRIPGAKYARRLPGMKYARRLPGAKYAAAPLSAPLSAARRLSKNFVPQRDSQKAQVVRNLNVELVNGHANWLAQQDRQSGRPVRARSYYVQQSKPWARQNILQVGLPVTFSVRGADVLGAEILGADVVGTWQNSPEWFARQSKAALMRTKAERLAAGASPEEMSPEGMPPEGMPVEEYPGMPAEGAYPEGAYPEGAYPEVQGDPLEGVAGEDSLGAFATEILAGPAPVVRTESDAVQEIKQKMKSGQALSPGEVAVLATLAKRDPEAKRVYGLLFKHGRPVTVVGDDSGDGSGAWLHKLNPMYWFKSSREKKLIDVERAGWIQNAKLQKDLAKKRAVLEQAEKAKSATLAVEQAKAQAAATEAQLAEIEKSLPTATAGDDVLGHEKPTEVSEVVASALRKAGKYERALALSAKVRRGETLTKPELKEAQAIARTVGRLRVVHGDLLSPASSAALAKLHGELSGACLRGGVELARRQNEAVGRLADKLSGYLKSGKPLTERAERAVGATCRNTARLQRYVRAHTSGKIYAGLDDSGAMKKAAVASAAKAAMTDAEKKMLASIVSLAKAGNPRAAEALKKLRASGSIVGGDFVGFSIKNAFKFVTKPIWYPAQKLGQGLKWIGKKAGIVSKGSPTSPEQVRLNMMRAAAKRRLAAAARARAADAHTEAEIRAQEALASAADAEADADEAEAAAKQAAMLTREVEVDPSAALAAPDEESSGDDVLGRYTSNPEAAEDGWEAFVGDDALGKFTENPEAAEDGWGAFVGAEDQEIMGKARETSPAGAKLRAGATLYRKARRGDPQAKRAVAAMVARAKRGDAQAKRDLVAVKAGRKAVLAKQKAQRRQVLALARKARAKKVIAFRKRLEATVANKLARTERRVKLYRASVVESKAARGNKRAKKYVAKQVALAKSGDKKAKRRVATLKLAQRVRKAAPTKRERRNVAVAQKLYERAQRGNPKAVRQLRVIQAAAAKGNPNAKRAVQRLQVARDVSLAIAVGTIATLPAAAVKDKKKRQALAAQVAQTKKKLAAKTATREELAASAKAAKALGDPATAGELALASAAAPSATANLKQVASVVAAKEQGNPEATKVIDDAFEASKRGDAEAVGKMAKVVAVQTIDDVNKGKDVIPAMRDAANLQARIEAGDATAVEAARQIAEAATAPNPVPEATAAAIALGAAAMTSRALAAKPKAKAEYLARVNQVPLSELPAAQAQLQEYVRAAEAGTITPEEGVVATRLAARLGQPKVAAEIAAKAPPPPPATPLSTLPDLPQAPVRGGFDLVKETLRALTFSTRDPLANYREGVASRSKGSSVQAGEPVDESGVSDSGWSPFPYFKKILPIVLPGVAAATSTASLVMAAAARKSSPKPAPAPAPAPARAPAPAPSPAAAKPNPHEDAKPNPHEPSQAVAGDDSGAEKTFKDYVGEALKFKKMSKKDFNKAVNVQVGEKASTLKKVAVGEKLLAFLSKKGVKVEA